MAKVNGKQWKQWRKNTHPQSLLILCSCSGEAWDQTQKLKWASYRTFTWLNPYTLPVRIAPVISAPPESKHPPDLLGLSVFFSSSLLNLPELVTCFLWTLQFVNTNLLRRAMMLKLDTKPCNMHLLLLKVCQMWTLWTLFCTKKKFLSV